MNPFNHIYANKSAGWIIMILTALFIGTALTGCMENFGRLKINKEIGDTFDAGRVLPEYTYYYNGNVSRPYAIVGLRNDFTIKSDTWKKIDNPEKRLQKLVDFLYDNRSRNPYGATILGPDGQPIGIWYSSIRSVSIEVKRDSRTVVIIPDRPSLHDDSRSIGIKKSPRVM